MPFLKGRCDSDLGKTLDCLLGQPSFDPESLLPRSTQILTECLQENLQKRYGDRVIPLTKVRGIYEGLSSRQKGGIPPEPSGKNLARSSRRNSWSWEPSGGIENEAGVLEA